MKILHLIGRDAGPREREQQRLDANFLDGVDVMTADLAATNPRDGSSAKPHVIHAYGGPDWDLIRTLSRPWIADREPPRSRLPWKRIQAPAVAPDLVSSVDESVDPSWLVEHEPAKAPGAVASLAGPARSEMRRHVLARLARVRSDVEWVELRRPPTPSDMWRFGLWVDPGLETDGGTLEAIAWGMPVVATRTPTNERRSAGGDAAVLVPHDANEIAHVILGALFKPETIESRVAAAVSQRSRFDPRRRAATLHALYQKAAR